MRIPFKTKMMITMVIASCLIIVLMTGISLSCGKIDDKVILPTSFSELSLVQLWDKVLEITDVQNKTAELSYFSIDVNETGILDLCVFEFYGRDASEKSKVYHAEIGARELRWYSWDSIMHIDNTSENHPLGYFEELDKFEFETWGLSDEGFSIYVDPSGGFGGYGDTWKALSSHNDDTTDVYHLEDGELTPIKKIIFNRDTPVCTITIRSRYGVVPGWYRVWLITSDLDNATTVEYLEI